MEDVDKIWGSEGLNFNWGNKIVSTASFSRKFLVFSFYFEQRNWKSLVLLNCLLFESNILFLDFGIEKPFCDSQLCQKRFQGKGVLIAFLSCKYESQIKSISWKDYPFDLELFFWRIIEPLSQVSLQETFLNHKRV